MRLSQNFIMTLKHAPSDESSKNAQLLIRAGYVYKVMAGVYAYTPLGLRVIENIKSVVRREMNVIGGQELLMSSLQPSEPWRRTGRWDSNVVDIWFKTRLQAGDTELGLAWSHEEAIIEMLKSHINSYKDFPVKVYQFQTKLRNELRAKSGIMRGREFLMKDMYSFHTSEAELTQFYEASIEAYKRVYNTLGIGDDTYVTFASGGAFTKFSHEFQTICDAGEDTIYVHREKNIAINEEVLDDACKELGIEKTSLEAVKTAEVGNIFNFGTTKSKETGLLYTNELGNQVPFYMGSYGIGISRLMGVIVEKFSDDKGIVWPMQVAPALVHIVLLGGDGARVKADQLYEGLSTQQIEVLYDDRDTNNYRAGQKFMDAALMGVPYQITISDRNADSETFEFTERSTGLTIPLTQSELIDRIN